MSKPILGYWNYRGLGHPIRFLLAYAEVDYDEQTYEMGGPPDHSWDPWLQEKHKLGFSFPNVPYWIDGELKVTQVRAILKHIARSRAPELLPNPNAPALQAEADMLDTIVMDNVWWPMAQLCYNYTPELESTFKKETPVRLAEISDYLGEKLWLLGENISYLDFILYESLTHHRAYDSNLTKNLPNLDEFLKRFEALPAIKKYMESPNYLAGPFYSPRAILTLDHTKLASPQ